MSDQRGGPGGPEGPDGPGFGWLYGSGPEDAPGGRGGVPLGKNPPPPDPTRAIPVTPPPPDATRVVPTGPAAPPPPGPGTPSSPAGPPPPGRRRHPVAGFLARRVRRPRFWIRTVLLLLVLWLVFTIATPFLVWRTSEQIAFAPGGDRPAEQDGTTYLLVGNDSRKGLTAEERRKYSTGNPSSELTDTMMLMHTGSGPNVLVSIPRDTIVDMPGYGLSKINSAYARGGPKLLVKIIERETGIRIDQLVEIGLGGVADVVDAVGGIEVCPIERIKDPLAGLNIRKGCQDIDGETALAYSRSRKQSTYGDLERVRRQREVVSAIGDAVLSPWTVLNPWRWWHLNKAVPSFFRFGKGMSTTDAAFWAYGMTRVELTCTVPVTDLSAETWDRDLADPLFQAIADDDTDAITKAQCTPNGIPRS
ncbi:LCP family protein [Nocardioides sp.]|uniref:LCP family protein n=1 Tax=Nocardioides sp. TaxID=35761 RepID=UPI0035131C7F